MTEYRSSDVSDFGYIAGNTFASKRVIYSIINGEAIFEGDIVLGTEEELKATQDQAEPVATAVIITGDNFRWPNGAVPFTIANNFPNQQRIVDAIAHWEQRTRIRFVPRSIENNYVTFRQGSGCSSMVGMRGGNNSSL